MQKQSPHYLRWPKTEALNQPQAGGRRGFPSCSAPAGDTRAQGRQVAELWVPCSSEGSSEPSPPHRSCRLKGMVRQTLLVFIQKHKPRASLFHKEKTNFKLLKYSNKTIYSVPANVNLLFFSTSETLWSQGLLQQSSPKHEYGEWEASTEPLVVDWRSSQKCGSRSCGGIALCTHKDTHFCSTLNSQFNPVSC